MKNSIFKIFKNLNLFLMTILILIAISFLFVVEQYYSYQKVHSLNNQKTVLLNILNAQEKSDDLTIYQYNADIASLNFATDRLENQHQYNYISVSILQNTSEYNADLNKLRSLVQKFDKTSRAYFAIDTDDKEIKEVLISLKEIYGETADFIDTMILKNVTYDNSRFNIVSILLTSAFFLLLFVTFWYKSRLNNVYNDILFLYSVEGNKNKETYTQEVDAVLLRMKRKSQLADNPAMMDPITEIYNNKGMIHAYSERKALKDNNFSSVSILEIDNFSKNKRTYSQEFTQEILKKVAYTISLHQQATDIIARSDYNQFTLVFSRPSKEQLFKHTDLIRQSISELKLLSPDKEIVNISVTGGFVNKTNLAPLEEAIRKAKELLQKGKLLGKDRVVQIKDIPKDQL